MTEQPPARRRGPGRPVTTGTKPVRTTRQGGEWDEADAIARARGATVHDVIGTALRQYVQQHRGDVAGCEMCGKPVPAPTDPKISRSRQGRVCSRTCERRMVRQSRYRRDQPACESREQYATREDARKAATAGETPYHCDWCGNWQLSPEGGKPG